MRKVKIFLFIFIIFIIPSLKVNALTTSQIASRSVCASFEVAVAKSDGSLTNLSCQTTYAQAKTAMDAYNSTSSAVSVILERVSGTTTLIEAELGIVNLHRGSSTTNIYTTSALSSAYTYISANQSYGGTDAALLGINYSNKAVRLKLSGLTGWVAKGQYSIVPLSWVKSTNYYSVTADTIKHCYTKNLLNTQSSTTCNTIGPKPTMLAAGTYYSYDGNYMYANLTNLLTDYKSGITSNSVNSSNPYYNYYQYLPHRGKSTYSSMDIDAYIRSFGYVEKTYNGTRVSGQSMLYGEGTFFYHAQNLYGANALLMFGVARNESGMGTSAISIDKYNLFGHGASDSNPYVNASKYLTVKHAIYYHAFDYVSYAYSEPFDWRYFGGHVGNKQSGFNVKYASDPYWGEKAAAHYYAFDKANGMQDYNYYQLAVKKDGSSVAVRKSPNTSSVNSYNMARANEPIIIVGEVTGTSINGSNIWYKIISDETLDANGKKILYNAATMPEYRWGSNSYVYVHSSYFKKVNTVSKLNDPNSVFEYPDSKYTYKTYYNASTKVLTPKIGMVTASTKVYYESALVTVKNDTLKQGAYVVLLEEAKDQDGEIVSYLISYNANRNTREWIPANKVRVVNNTYGRVKSNAQNVKNQANGSTTYGTVNTDTYVAILNQTTVSGNKWLQINYDARGNTSGWILASSLEYDSTKVVVENPGQPIVSFNEITHVADSKFNVSGSLVIDGMNITSDKTVVYSLILKDENDSTNQYQFNLDRWLEDYPYKINSLSGYDFSGGWFKKTVDLKDVAAGNYVVYVKIEVDGEQREVLFTNLSFKPMTKRVEDETNNKGYEFRSDYYSKDVKLNLFVRDEELITDKEATSYQNMFNTFFTISLQEGKLNILGNAFTIDGDYSVNSQLERTLILENTNTYLKYNYSNIGHTTNAPYNITLSSVTKDLTKAWYNCSVDISSLPAGKYTMIIYNKSGTNEDYGEIYDIAFRDVNYTNTYNGKTYTITRNDNLRYRLELNIS